MDKMKLIEAFKATLVPDQREQAEVYLNEVKKIINFVPQVFSIVLDGEVDPAVRQSAVIFMKNNIDKHWPEVEAGEIPTEPLPFVLHEADKQVIRENIVHAMVTLPETLRQQLAVSLSTIIKNDFPGKWPGFVEKVLSYLNSTDPAVYPGAFTCVYMMVKAYEYKKTKEKASSLEAMFHFLPLMRQRCLDLMTDSSKELMVVKKIIIKTFFTLVHFSLPMTLVNEEVFNQWMEIAKCMLEAPTPPECDQLEEDEKGDSVWWKCKKWAIHLMSRVFERFGSPGNVLKEYKQFSDWFLKTYAVGLQQSIMLMLGKRLRNEFVSPRVTQIAFAFLSTGVTHSLTWKALKPHSQVLIEQVIFPLLGHSEEDQELWTDDPVEYIKIKYDVFDEICSPTSNAQSLLATLVQRRMEILQKTMTFCIEQLVKEDVASKDRALHMIGCLSENLCKKKLYKEQIEGLMMTQVIPHLTSQAGFLRARASWMVHRFAHIKFKNQQNVFVIAELLLKLLHEDADLPVKVEAVLALHDLQNEQEKVQEFLIPHFKQIFTDLLSLIRITEVDDVNSCLQSLVFSFEEQVRPLALEISTHLVETSAKLLATCNDPGEDHSTTLMSILSTLETICQVLEEHKETLQSIEGVVIEVIKAILVSNNSDYFESMFTLIYSLTVPQVTPQMWDALPIIYDLFKKEDNMTFFTDMMPALHNFITVDPSACISDPSRIEIIFNMAKDVLTNDEMEDDCECHAAKLLEIMLLEYKDQSVLVCKMTPLFVNLVIGRLSRPIKDNEVKTMCLQVILAALFTNASLTLAVLQEIPVPNQQGGMIRKVVEEVLKEHESFYGIHDRKMYIVGLCTLLSLTGDLRPATINELAPTILPALIDVFKRIKKAYEYQSNELESEDGDKEDEEEEDEANHDDDDDVVDQDHEDYMQRMEKAFGDDDDDEDDEDDLEEETILESYDTAIDKEDSVVEEYQMFRTVIEGIRSIDNQWYNQLTVSLNDDNKKELDEIFVTAEKKRAFLESKRIEQAGGYQFNNMQVPNSFCFNASSPPPPPPPPS